MKHTSTSLRLSNSVVLWLHVSWAADEDGHGWRGECVVWRDHNRVVNSGHVVSVRQGVPLGTICVELDPHKAGAWMFYDFPGVGITERDLQWATVFAAAAIQHKRSYMGLEKLDRV